MVILNSHLSIKLSMKIYVTRQSYKSAMIEIFYILQVTLANNETYTLQAGDRSRMKQI